MASNDKDKLQVLNQARAYNVKINFTDYIPDAGTDEQKKLYHSVNIFNRSEFESGIFEQRYRYGVLNPYQNITTSREVLFFTRPDLHIFNSVNAGGAYGSLNPDLAATNPFWNDLNNRNPEVLYMLQSSMMQDKYGPFNNLLANMVQSNLDVPSVSADLIETSGNMYGTSYKYRGSSEGADDNHTFSLEFKDTKYLPVYNFFKAYELYEIAKHHGRVAPKAEYIRHKVLHDQYSIYKFILDEDMETIIFYAKYYGVKSVNLPRDVFNSTTYDNGLSYSIDFEAAFVEDSNPYILGDFNELSKSRFYNCKYDMPVYNKETKSVDMRSAKYAVVVQEKSGTTGYNLATDKNGVRFKDDSGTRLLHGAPGGIVYKLKWKGDQKV